MQQRNCGRAAGRAPIETWLGLQQRPVERKQHDHAVAGAAME